VLINSLKNQSYRRTLRTGIHEIAIRASFDNLFFFFFFFFKKNKKKILINNFNYTMSPLSSRVPYFGPCLSFCGGDCIVGNQSILLPCRQERMFCFGREREEKVESIQEDVSYTIRICTTVRTTTTTHINT
jgi:hypothetical protein